jgi:hypothetical protein
MSERKKRDTQQQKKTKDVHTRCWIKKELPTFRKRGGVK